jgi:protein ImuB
VTRLAAGTSTASRDPAHLARLFREKFRQAGDDFDAGYGIEAMSLAALAVDALSPAQATLAADEAKAHDVDVLIDRLGNRLGARRVRRLAARASHMPERAVMALPAMGEAAAPSAWRMPELAHRDGVVGRPLRMLSAPEPVEVTAEIPEGPPKQFRWRKVLYEIARAEGPERIAPEWWRRDGGRTRDYYRVEDIDGRRFWLYRDGLYTRDADLPRWYLQGMFG